MDADRLAEIKARHVRVPYEFLPDSQALADLHELVAEVEQLQAENDELKQGEPCFLLVHASDGTPYPTVRALGPPEAVAALEAAIGTADGSPPIPELNNGSLVRAYGQTWRVNGCGSGSDPRTHEIKSFSVHFDLVKAENDGR